MWSCVRSGEWLTAARLRAYPLILLVLSLAIAIVWVALADGLIDRNGKPIGTDFTNVYAAGTLALEGRAEAAYDPVRQHAAEKAVFDGREVPFYGWHYPPLFLILAAVLALLPYGLALLAWAGLTLAAYLAVMRAILPRPETALVALAFPAVLVNLGHGQNGFLSAALLGGGLLLLDRRPVVAGLLFGLLAYKPQFGLLLPLVLAASGRWSAFGAAAAAVIAVSLAATGLFGSGIWPAFLHSTAFTREVVLEGGGTGWAKIQSLFAAVRMWGGGVDAAYAAQGTLALAAAACLLWLWRSPAAHALKAAALACACLLATPYVLDYDLVVLAVAIAFFAVHGLAHGFRDYEISVLAAVWLAPLLARSVAGATALPLGFAAVAALFILTLRRAAFDVAASQRSERLAQA